MEELASKINALIKESLTYKVYLEYKNKVEEDKSLKVLRDEMAHLKKELCKAKNDKLLGEYNELEKEYRSNAIVKEYEKSREKMENLLRNITDILSLK